MSDEQPWYGDKWAGNETLARYKTMDDFIKAGLEAKTEIGKLTGRMGNMIEIPKDTESFLPLLPRLGLPQTPDGYELPDGGNPVVKKFAAAMHGAGVLPFQAKKLAEAVVQFASEHGKETEAAAAAEREKAIAAVREEWGEKAGEYEETIERWLADKENPGVQAYEKLATTDIRLAKRLGAMLAAPVSKEAKGLPSVPNSPAAALETIGKLRREAIEANKAGKKHWFTDPVSEQHKKTRDDLYQAAYPKQ